MRSRRTSQDEMAAIAQRRLELLTAELAGIRGAAPVPTADPARSEVPADPGPPGHRPVDSVDPVDSVRRGKQLRGQVSGADPGDFVVPGPVEALSHDALVPGATGSAWPHAPAAASPEASAPWATDAPARGRHARRGLSAQGRFGGWLHDRLPPTLQGRVRLTAAHVAVVALLVAGAFAGAAWWVLRAEGSTTVVRAAGWADTSPKRRIASPTPMVTPVADPSGGVGGTGTAGVVVVDVEGKVRRPGIATLPAGSRVVDALEAAGGVRRGVGVTGLNLARVLLDGEQILVGVKAPGGVAAPAASASGGASGAPATLVSINSASETELEGLPGVGPVTAAAIVQWRTDNGPFTAVDELLEVSGIGDATLAKIAPFVTL